MDQLALRTEYSLPRKAYGKLADIIEGCSSEYLGICDTSGTWGHVPWSKECKKAGKKPIFGVELAVVHDMNERNGKSAGNVSYMRFIAKNNEGLSEIYQLTALATDKKYYVPRIDYTVVNRVSDNVIVLLGSTPNLELLSNKGNQFFELSCSTRKHLYEKAKKRGFKLVMVSQNYFPFPEDEEAYQVHCGSRNMERATYPLFIDVDGVLVPPFVSREDIVAGKENLHILCRSCVAEIQLAEMVKPDVKKNLLSLCEEGALKKNVSLLDGNYRERLYYELNLIEAKGFEDYFHVVADLVTWAKKTMLVGTARGSSCGSLVCYLLNITNVDPLIYGLLFERFIDSNRSDLPDIDIDFPDTARPKVFKYLQNKYGYENVAKLGTVVFSKYKSCLIDACREVNIPRWKIEDFKESIQDQGVGTLSKAFNLTAMGRSLLKDHPPLLVSMQTEGQAKHSGVHAAGIVITNKPIHSFCGVNTEEGCAMLDKHDAERLNMLKIDCLGLRTLSVIEDCLKMIGWKREDLENYPTDDKEAFGVLNKGSFSGIFQFEGKTLQDVTKQMEVTCLEDVATLTALCRPGALASGGTNTYLEHYKHPEKISYYHPLMEAFTQSTKGVLIYQEQVMRTAKEVGNLSWSRVSSLRKAISKSMGAEVMEGFREEFLKGARENGMENMDALGLWAQMVTMGGYAFNRSHAVAYAIMSYWCLVLKSKYPLEFACANLRNAKSDDQSVTLLRELSTEGFEFVNISAELSEENWSIHNGKLIGGFAGLKGVGSIMAKEIVRRREEGIPLTQRHLNLIELEETPWKNIFEATTEWGHVYEEPQKYNIDTYFKKAGEIPPNFCGSFVVLGKVVSFTQRDMNEGKLVENRAGKKMSGETRFLQIEIADDTGIVRAMVFSDKFLEIGEGITKADKKDYYLFKGEYNNEFKSLSVERVVRITKNKNYEKKE